MAITPNPAKAEVCPICLDEFTGNYAKIYPCHHRFHAECIKKWITRRATSDLPQTCPMCIKLVQLILPPAPPDPPQVLPQPGLPPAQPVPAEGQEARREIGEGGLSRCECLTFILCSPCLFTFLIIDLARKNPKHTLAVLSAAGVIFLLVCQPKNETDQNDTETTCSSGVF